MVKEKSKTARAVAIDVLNQFDPRRNYASTILDSLLSSVHQINEKQRATDLVFGTIRNRNAIDNMITEFSSRLVQWIPDKQLNIIRIAVYELVYSPATPEYSIVNEAVENTKAVGGKRQADFVNAVLRQITRHIKKRQSQLIEADPKCTIAQTKKIGCEFGRCFLPDPKISPADYLSTVFSLPKWLVTDWLDEFGPEKAQQICFASNRRPNIYIRPNILKTTARELAEKICRVDINAEIVPDIYPIRSPKAIGVDLSERLRIANGMEMIKIESPCAVTELPGFAEGLFTVQDITASQAVRLLKPQPGWTMLDLCAAPGTKATQLAELTGDSAKIIATDIDDKRLKMVKENTDRLGINSIDIIPYKQFESVEASRKVDRDGFDAILLDVPCSNTGVLAKRPEVRYRIKPKTITELSKIQADLLNKAVTMIKPKGIICYSTCSIQKVENDWLVRDFLKKNPKFKLETELLILPSSNEFDRDGGYTAIIARK